jgi:hypothetical protein
MPDRRPATFDESMAAFTLAITLVLAINNNDLKNGGLLCVEILASKINDLNINAYADIYVDVAYLGHAFGMFGGSFKYLKALQWTISTKERAGSLLIPAIGSFPKKEGKIISVPNCHPKSKVIDLRTIDSNHRGKYKGFEGCLTWCK